MSGSIMGFRASLEKDFLAARAHRYVLPSQHGAPRWPALGYPAGGRTPAPRQANVVATNCVRAVDATGKPSAPVPPAGTLCIF